MIRIALVNPEIPENTGNVGRLCVGLGAELHLIRSLWLVTHCIASSPLIG